MSAERGDRKPCTHAGCTGQMQYGRELPLGRRSDQSETRGLNAEAIGSLAWRCSEQASHFQRATDVG